MKEKDKKVKYERIVEIKVSTTTHNLCKGLPSEFSTYLDYCKNLKCEERPNYKFLRALFKELFSKLGYELDYDYDWNSMFPKSSTSSSPAKEEESKEMEVFSSSKIHSNGPEKELPKKK